MDLRDYTFLGTTRSLCPECRRPVERVSEVNYFFALSRYADRLLEYIEANPRFLQPDFRRNEVLQFIGAKLGGAASMVGN